MNRCGHRRYFLRCQSTSDHTCAQSRENSYLHLEIDSTELIHGRIIRKLSYLVPDHGKLMHMFLIRKDELDVFAHLHPERIDTLNYHTPIPPLPARKYHVFADITRYTGFSENISLPLSFSFVY